MLQQIISHSWNTLAFKIRPNFNLTNWEGHFFLSEWNAQFRFLARNKSFVSQIVNILLANYSAKTDKSGPQILDTWIFPFLPKRYHTQEKIKGQALELNERGQVSEGAISWGGFIKTSFMAFLLPAGGGEDRGKEFIPFADPLIL